MSIFKDTFKPEIQNQLKARQEAIFERTPDAIQYFNARNAWVRMSSAVDVNEDNGALAKKYILQGGVLYENQLQLRAGVLTKNSSYDIATPNGNPHRLGIRPMPGITGVDIKPKSAYGSLREVEVKFVAWDIKQLEDLELLYMRPGYTALIEWGWAPYLGSDKKLKSNIDFSTNDIINKKPTKDQLFESIYKTAVETYGGNYDAMFGYIKNYSWSAREDGGYDCTTTIISVGEVLESLKVNYAPFNNISEISKKGLIAPRVEGISISSFPDIKKIYSKNILAGLFYELFTIMNLKKPGTQDEGANFVIADGRPDGTTSYYDLYKKTLNIAGGQGEASSNGKIGASDEQVYITLEGLCNLINNYVTFVDSNSKKAFLKCSVLDREYAIGNTKPNPLTGDGYLLCSAHPLQLSVDPTICIIKNPVWANGFKVNPDTIIPSNVTGSNNLITFPSKLSDVQLDSVLDQLYYISIPTKKIKDKQAVVDYLERVTQQDPDTIKALTKRHYEKLKDVSYKVVKPQYTDLINVAIDEGDNIDNTKLGKSLAASGVGGSTSLFSFLTTSRLTNLSTQQVNEAFGSNVESTKSDPVAAQRAEDAKQQAELDKQKKEIEKSQSTAIENIQYIKNISRPYFYQDNWDTELGIIGNIYVNLNFLFRLALDNNLEALDTKEKKDINLYNFLKSVLSEISSATGNVSNFDLFIDPIKGDTTYIIDVNYVDAKSKKEVYDNLFQLEMHNTKSTVRSYKLESQIFPDQSSTVAIGAQVGGGAMATDNNTMLDFNKGLVDRIIPKKDDPTIDPNQPDIEKIKSQAQNVADALQSLYDFFGDQEYGWFIDGKFDADKAGDYKNSLKDLINFFKNLTKSKAKNRAIIPTKLSVTMDGIGGLVIGHLFRIPEELLPRGYKGDALGSKLGHTITGIGHSIQNNDWTTNIDAQTIILDEPEGTLSFSELIQINPNNGKITTQDAMKIEANKSKLKVGSNLSGVVSKYGQPGDSSQLVTLTLPYTLYYDSTPVNSFKVHKLVKDSLEKVLKDILATYGLDKIKKLKLDQYSGLYNPRDKRCCPGNPSIHSWGIAIDFYAAENGLNTPTGKALFSKPEYKQFIDIWYKYGWKSFGRELGKDWMHFQINDAPF